MAILKLFTDKEALRRIRTNDRTILGELFSRNINMIVSYVTQNWGTAADAEDLLQEAIVIVWQKVCTDELRLTAKLSTYLMAIVKNIWRDESRRRRRGEHSPLSHNIIDSQPQTLDSIILDEEAEMVQRGLNGIGLTCRKLLTLFYFEERNFKDIARLMEFASADVAKSKKYQCKNALADILKKMIAEKGNANDLR